MQDDSYSSLREQYRRTLTILTFLLCLVAVPGPPAHAETAICSEGAYETLYSTLGLFSTTTREYAEPGRTTYIRHESLRGLIAAARCPSTAEKRFAEDRDLTQRWIAALPEILKPYLTTVLKAETLRDLASAIKCDPGTPLVCDLAKALSKLPGAQAKQAGRSPDVSAVCGSLGPTLMTDASADLAVTSLADVITRDLAFLSSTCPAQFYAHMHGHREGFESWLRWVNTQMFVGSEAGQKASLEAYREALIASVQASLHNGQYVSEKQQVLAHLQAKKVRIID